MSSVNRAPEPRPVPLFQKLKPTNTGRAVGGNGRLLTPEEVVTDQRQRMIAVMIDNVGRRGYTATGIRELCALAGVSKHAPYDAFGDKEGWFLAAYDVIVRLAVRRVKTAYLAEPEWQQQLASGVRVFVDYVAEQPAAARVALIEALGAGDAALRRMDTASRSFERMIRSSFRSSPQQVELPPLVGKGIVGGIARVVRQRLLDDRVGELRSSSDDLFRWIIAHHSAAVGALPPAPTGPRDLDKFTLTFGEEDDARVRMLRSAAYVTARYGIGDLSIDGIVRHADTSVGDFISTFPEDAIMQCYLEAYDFLGGEVAECAADAADAVDEWPAAIRAGLAALLRRLASDPVYARMAFVDIFTVGPQGIARRSNLIQSFRDLLRSRAPKEQRPSELTAEAIVGAVWEMAHFYTTRGACQLLPGLVDHSTYFVLAPIIGAEAAIEVVRSAAGKRA
jgi:AcrR family transcriptional regulator